MKSIYLFVGLSMAFLSFGFIQKDSSTQKTIVKSIPIGDAKEIETQIDFIVGKLNLSSKTKKLSEGTFKFFKQELEPEITYNEESNTGHLKIASQKWKIDMDSDNDEKGSQWDIAINKEIKNSVSIKLIAGEGNIDLHDCLLKKFEFKMTAGEVKINLNNTSVPDFSFKALAGNAVIDLSGKWTNDMHASIKGGVGQITLKLPKQVGVKLSIKGLLGSVNTQGLDKQGEVYTNDKYGNTKETLYFDITGGIGDVNIKMVE